MIKLTKVGFIADIGVRLRQLAAFSHRSVTCLLNGSIYFLISNLGCNGGLMDNAFAEIIRIGGLETEDDYAYDAHAEQVYNTNLRCYLNNRIQCHFEESKAKVFINGSLDIGQDEDEIAEALMEHGPLAIALNAAWMQFYHGGVSHPLSYLCDPSGLGTFINYGLQLFACYLRLTIDNH